MPSTAFNAIAFRRELHRHPELSGQEAQTARRVIEALEPTQPTRLLTGLGGHGVAAMYSSGKPGPRVLIRADMDALPIHEATPLEHASTVEGVAHKCGHDGHTTMLLGFAHRLAATPPPRGEVVLLFQPAEETGQGAAAVIADPQWSEVQPDISVGLHNLPGFPLGSVVLRHGPFASASVGVKIHLHGRTAHAAEPERGQSPALAVAALINALSALPQTHTGLADAAKVTVIHARLGEVAFGTTPGEAVVMATLRSHRTEVLNTLKFGCESLAEGIAATHGLTVDLEWVEEFPATVNDPALADLVRDVASAQDRELIEPAHPFPWSEDFGHFGSDDRRAVFFGLGSGTDHPVLHHPDYDFPDDLIPHGVALFDDLVRRILTVTDET